MVLKLRSDVYLYASKATPVQVLLPEKIQTT